MADLAYPDCVEVARCGGVDCPPARLGRMVRSESIGDQLLAFVEYLYPHFKKPWRNYPNLEEFLSLCAVYLVFRKKVKRKHAFEDAPGAG